MANEESKSVSKYVRDAGLHMWVIYKHPSDFPNQFVVREWWIVYGDPEVSDTFQTADTIEDARQLIPAALHCIPRDPADEPQIVETWI